MMLSKARPTSPASDQTKRGGVRSGVQRTSPKFGAESERSDLMTKIQLSSKLSPKEFAKKFREWMGKLGEMSIPPIAKQKANRQRDLKSLHIHTEKRSGRAAPEILEE